MNRIASAATSSDSLRSELRGLTTDQVLVLEIAHENELVISTDGTTYTAKGERGMGGTPMSITTDNSVALAQMLWSLV